MNSLPIDRSFQDAYLTEAPANPVAVPMPLEEIETRWFIATAAAQELEGESAAALRAVERATQAYQRTQAELREIIALRQSLAEQLAEVHGPRFRQALKPA